MLDKIVSGLLLAFVTGLTFLAYKHPLGYRRIVVFLAPLVGGMWLAFVWGALFSAKGAADTGVEISRRWPDQQLSSVAEHFELISDYAMYGHWTLVVGVSTAAYLVFLWFLPSLVGKKNPDAA